MRGKRTLYPSDDGLLVTSRNAHRGVTGNPRQMGSQTPPILYILYFDNRKTQQKEWTILNCYMCEYDGNCSLQEIAPDITGCEGHSKYKGKRITEENLMETQAPDPQPYIPQLSDFEIGDIVQADSNPYNLKAFRLPGYLSGQCLKVIGRTKTKVKCDWDGGNPFHIPPELLRKKE